MGKLGFCRSFSFSKRSILYSSEFAPPLVPKWLSYPTAPTDVNYLYLSINRFSSLTVLIISINFSLSSIARSYLSTLS